MFFLERAVFTTVICIVPLASELPPDVHKIIDIHFGDLPFGRNLYFCSSKDSLDSFALSTSNSLVTRKNLSSKTITQEFQLLWSFVHRISVFVDSSCQEGLMFLQKHKKKMDLNFRWLVFVDSIATVMDVLNSSRLEIDSDVTLITKQEDGQLILSRPSRIYFKTPLTLSANYSLADVDNDRNIGQAFDYWNKKEFGFGNYCFDANVVFLISKHGNFKDWYLLLNKSIEPGVENTRRYLTHPATYLMEMYNFTLNILLSTDWGLPQANGSFSGALGLVERREVEFGFSAVRQDPVRIKCMAFSFPVIDCRFNWVLIQPKTFGTPAALVVPFSLRAWLAFFALTLLLIVVVRLTKLTDKRQLRNDSWGESMMLVLSSVSQNGIDEIATKCSSQIAFFVVALSTFLIFSHYSASVLNGLILPSPDRIQNIENLLSSDDIDLGTQEIVYMHREFMRNDSITIRARTARKTGIQYFSFEAGLDRVKRGHFAFYGLDTDTRSAMKALLTDEEMCLITEIQMTREFSLSYVWPKQSPFAEIMNRGLIIMRERGILSYLQTYWLVQKPKCRMGVNSLSIKLKGMSLAYGVFGFGLLTSLITIIIELIIAARMRRRPIRPFVP